MSSITNIKTNTCTAGAVAAILFAASSLVPMQAAAGDLASADFKTLAYTNQGGPAERASETVFLKDDDLEVTVASASLSEPDPLDSELTIWVGEVNLNGQNVVWVELLDGYGEVVYESRIRRNETHLLPDGRAIVARSMETPEKIVKLDHSRVASDGPMMVTRRTVEPDNGQGTAVEFLEAEPKNEEPVAKADPSALWHLAQFGNSVWATISGFFAGAAAHVQVAWNWITGTRPA